MENSLNSTQINCAVKKRKPGHRGLGEEWQHHNWWMVFRLTPSALIDAMNDSAYATYDAYFRAQ